MSEKKKVLLVWWYDRKDLIAPYLEMQNSFEFTVLFYRFKSQENSTIANELPFKRIYWTEYLSPYQLLDEINPEKILFFGTEDMLSTALIVAAKIKSIDTCYVSHGLRGSLSEIISSIENNPKNKIERYSADNPDFNRKKWHSFIFLANAASIRNLRSIYFILQCFYISFRISNAFSRLLYLDYELRKPDFYYFFAKSNAKLFLELDNAPIEKIKYTGPYTMDSVFKEFTKLSSNLFSQKEPYWVLIDQPLSSVIQEEKVKFFKKLSQIASQKGRRVYVKLHPMEYNFDYSSIENIEWIKQTSSLNELIINAEGCLGYHSALLLPIIPIKKCILFNPEKVSLTDQWAEIGAVKLLDFESFSTDELDFESFDVTEEAKKRFIEEYITFQDGKCTERLKQLILEK